MHREVCVLILAILAMSTGCRTADQSSIDPARPTPTTGPGARTETAESLETGMPAIVEPAGVVVLRDVLAMAMSHNPQLGAFPYELRAADARATQAGLPPNPELGIEIEEFAGSGERSGFDAAQTTVRIDVPIELGGKRARRANVAQLDRELAEWDYRSARLDVIREATQAFVAVSAAQDRVTLASKLVELSRQAQSAVAQRVEAGLDSPVDELRASVALSTGRIELQKAEKALAAARHNLAAVWGGRTAAFERVSGDLSGISPPVPPEDPTAAIAANPDVGRWETQERKQRAVLHLEKAGAIPDVTIGGGVQRFEESNDSALVLGVGVPIPLFDRNQGSIREAVAGLAKTRCESQAVQVRTLAALSEATSALTAAYEEVTVLRDDVLPKAEQAFAAAESGYRQGKFDYLYVLDTQRTLFETQAGYIDAVEAYHRSQADVQRLIGGPPNAEHDDNRPSNSAQEPSSKVK
jgi:cobalt-zinc-cadmium efflux system outer membrane protein